MDINLFPAMKKAAVALLIAFLAGADYIVDALAFTFLVATLVSNSCRPGRFYPIDPITELHRHAALDASKAKSDEDGGMEEFLLHLFVLPENIASQFPSGVAVVGGMARMAAHCMLSAKSWPEGYKPRDWDYLAFDPLIPFGELRGGRAERVDGAEADRLVVQSFQSYCALLDLTSNGVMVVDGMLYLDKEAYQAFQEGVVNIRPENRALKDGISGLEYLCLRAAVQTGYDLALGVYHPRAGALKLDESMIQCLRVIRPDHWYMRTYLSKIEQIKSGKH